MENRTELKGSGKRKVRTQVGIQFLEIVWVDRKIIARIARIARIERDRESEKAWNGSKCTMS